ncbi:hypothetical protein NBO_975g0001 [Nosema bombycis CQ1]|uniref:Uncharacterized protein n=1 Tax=Nosema bombycis (strain CQ1 / CVCC 102059) TaxID=578461 RepID=R0MC68_NOSB1|nr:hypothetical protein NBO_975g0001 [Nosema bombycis CQ1]|eukprot:EOB11650.1 hypothetical protein NBO_975g0001 [Nosema bombycis CQ1]
MNNDVFREVLKYVGNSVDHKKIDKLLISSPNMKRKLEFVSKTIETKLKTRPSLDDLREKNILKTEEDLIKIKENKEQVNKLLQKEGHKLKDSKVAPSISNLVKKMDFEYKKILILHKLGINKK